MTDVQATVEYRDIPGHPGYRAGSDGTIWTRWAREPLRGPGKSGTRTILTDTWKRMECKKPARSGHLRVNIKGRIRFVHRLVLLAFIGPCPDGLEGCHNDGNPANNRLDNLRWDTRQSNMADQMRHGVTTRGERQWMAKLTAAGVRAIRAAYAAGRSSESIAAEHGVSRQTVAGIVYGRTWKHVA